MSSSDAAACGVRRDGPPGGETACNGHRERFESESLPEFEHSL
ncbi:hypothetical protein [Burkholderia sp. A9]|nr:hypothetical protein [Burkholderia sp. A9]